MLTNVTYWFNKLELCIFQWNEKMNLSQTLRWNISNKINLKQMQSTKENSFQTNEAQIQPKTRWAMWSMPEKRHSINKQNFSNVLNGNQSNKRTNNWFNKLELCIFQWNEKMNLLQTLRWNISNTINLKQMQSTKGNSFQTSEAKIQPKIIWEMWSMPKKTHSINNQNFSNLLNGNQSNKRTNKRNSRRNLTINLTCWTCK